MSLISHLITRVVIVLFAAIVATPIALSLASMKRFILFFYISKVTVARYVARVKKKTNNA